MFGIRKLKRKVNEVSERLEKSEKSIFELERELWVLKNPAKFKVGDKVGDILITGYYTGSNQSIFNTSNFYHNYECFNGKKKFFANEQYLIPYSIPKPPPEKEKATKKAKAKKPVKKKGKK